MTKEEARDYIREWCPHDRQEEIIKALEQEPCEDAISRQAVLDDIAKIGLWKSEPKEVQAVAECLRAVEALPPVTPQPKTGRWIKSRDSYGNNHFTCPFCEHDIATKANTWKDNYCANCGARLESEDKE